MTSYEMNYRKSDIQAFFNENVKKKLMRTLIISYTMIGIMVFLIFLSAIVIFTEELSFAKPLPYIFLAVLAVVMFFAITRTLKSTPEKMYKEFMAAYDKDTITCSFSEDRLFIRNSNGSDEENGYVMYENLEKTVESDNYFYIFVNKENAQIIRKSAITQGTVDETRNILRKAMGKQYVNITKYRGN